MSDTEKFLAIIGGILLQTFGTLGAVLTVKAEAWFATFMFGIVVLCGIWIVLMGFRHER